MKYLLLTALGVITMSGSLAQTHKAAAYIDSFAKQQPFNGTILINQPAKPRYKKSFGMANFAFKIPNTPDTRYKIASITKLFTSVLILQLEEQGKLTLDNFFGVYLPDYKGPAGTKVTVRQLLNMTAGMKNIDAGTTLESALAIGIDQYQHPYTLDQLLNKYAYDTLVAIPGARFDYNNLDFLLLGKIIETLHGKSFEQVLGDQVLQPLKMTNTGMLTQATIVDRLADTYFYRDDLKMLSNDLPVYWGNWYAAGSMYSNVDDLAIFSQALFGGKLLKKSSMDQLMVSGYDEYGLGVWVYKDYKIKSRNYTIVKRPGSIMGAQAMLFHVLEKGVTILILSNTGTVSLDEFAASIADRLIE